MASSNVDQAERYKSQGNAALQAGLYSDAVDLYTKAIGLDPNCAVFFSNRSAAYANLERWREALDDAQEVVGLKPDWVKGHTRRGAAFHGLKKFEEARKAYLKASQLEPNNAQLKELMEKSAAALKADKEKDWENDLWSEDEQEDGQETPIGQEPAAGLGAPKFTAPSGDGKSLKRGRTVVAEDDGSGEEGARRSGGSGMRKKRKASERTVHLLKRALADASLESMRQTLAALGKGDEELGQRMLQMLEGLNAASSEGEDDDDGDDGDDD